MRAGVVGTPAGDGGTVVVVVAGAAADVVVVVAVVSSALNAELRLPLRSSPEPALLRELIPLSEPLSP